MEETDQEPCKRSAPRESIALLYLACDIDSREEWSPLASLPGGTRAMLEVEKDTEPSKVAASIILPELSSEEEAKEHRQTEAD